MKEILFDYLSKYIELSSEEKKVISSLDNFKFYPKNTMLLKEGELSDYGYFVIKGCLRTFYIIDGLEKTTEFYTELQFHEPQSKIHKKPSTYYISCVEDSIVMVGNSKMEVEIFEKFPKFEKLCRILTEKQLANNKEDFDKYKLASPEERYKNLIETRPELLQRVPQYQIASYLGIEPQSLSRLRARLLTKNKSNS